MKAYIQWNRNNATKVLHWMFPELPPDAEADTLTAEVMERELILKLGDWLVRTDNGLCSCSHDNFIELRRSEQEAVKLTNTLAFAPSAERLQAVTALKASAFHLIVNRNGTPPTNPTAT